MANNRWKTSFGAERRFEAKHGVHTQRGFYIQAYKLYQAGIKVGRMKSSIQEFIGELLCMSQIYHIEELRWNNKKIDEFVRKNRKKSEAEK
ncbi:hypothetical protein KQ232_12205 [Lacticaseibacillus paracasei]|uniref:hypothetical protein n=1 Tax=Lacticaseibacillus paracasei TaxID=1597 RepID=UPI001C1E5402|nr:hypothetical protein [Lacticaseibacillus paracasei]MBU6048332.1 hypothetical protein [Lacticaseibacillus paracasei]MCL4973151.1 hypothetical protein [Lacticaseibacillus paracasei]